MAGTITQFANNQSPSLPALDDNFSIAGNLTTIPCQVAGTNVLTLTQNALNFAPSWAITAYANYMRFSGVVAATNTGAVTAAIGALPQLPVFKDGPAGPTALAGGELFLGNAFTLIYDSTLNSGSGGWHLVSSTASKGLPANPSTLQIGTGAVISRLLIETATLAFSVVAANSFQEQSFSFAGVQINDALALGLPSLVAQAISYSAYVPAAGTVTVRAVNAATVTLTPASGIYRVTAMA